MYYCETCKDTHDYPEVEFKVKDQFCSLCGNEDLVYEASEDEIFTHKNPEKVKENGHYQCDDPDCACKKEVYTGFAKRISEELNIDKFIGINHGTREKIEIELSKIIPFKEARPIQIHLKEDSTIAGGPVLAMVMIEPASRLSMPPTGTVGQVSVKMFKEGLNQIGYDIVKLEDKES